MYAIPFLILIILYSCFQYSVLLSVNEIREFPLIQFNKSLAEFKHVTTFSKPISDYLLLIFSGQFLNGQSNYVGCWCF